MLVTKLGNESDIAAFALSDSLVRNTCEAFELNQILMHWLDEYEYALEQIDRVVRF